MAGMAEIYIGTVLLEKNRWAEKKTPTLRVGEWLGRFKADGFDGVELWANHGGGPEEMALMEASPIPISIFNSYVSFSDTGEMERSHAVSVSRRLNAPRIKYNVGNDPTLWKTYMENLQAWRAEFSDAVTLLCECHPGTLLEEAAEARRFFDEMGMQGHGIIVHPFNQLDTLGGWFKTFGPSISHAHLQMRDDDGRIVRFDRHPRKVREALRIMKDHGFQGSFTLEFTEGTGQPDESIEGLYENALCDFSFLKGMLGN